MTSGGNPGREPRPELPVDADADTVLAARLDLLAHRDHVIGLEAEAASLQLMVDRLLTRQAAQKERLAEVREKLERQRRRADRLQRELDALRGSPDSDARPRSVRRLLRRDDD